jgi:hypothetical protein
LLWRLGLVTASPFFYFLFFIFAQPSHMSINILSKKEDNLVEQETVREYPLVDKAYYVDTIASKVDNSEQWLIDTD